MNDELESYLIAMDTSMAAGPSVPAPLAPGRVVSPTATPDPWSPAHSEPGEDLTEEEEEPGRPPNKKVGGRDLTGHDYTGEGLNGVGLYWGEGLSLSDHSELKFASELDFCGILS